MNRGGTPSQLLRGTVSSDGAGRIVMNIVWKDGQSGQYFGTVTNVQETASGTLTAGLEGTTVDTTSGGSGSAARWQADGFGSGLGTGDGRYFWPMFCAKPNVVRYPLSGLVPTTTIPLPSKRVSAVTPKKLGRAATTVAPATTAPATVSTTASAPPTGVALAPGAIPQSGRVTAIDDVDVYNGPGGTFTIVALMRAGTGASVLARHPDGWGLLSGLGPAGTARVAADHLTPARCGAG